jgi:hypothetical protein
MCVLGGQSALVTSSELARVASDAAGKPQFACQPHRRRNGLRQSRGSAVIRWRLSLGYGSVQRRRMVEIEHRFQRICVLISER